MTPIERWKQTEPKLIAILRGIQADEIEEVVIALLKEGFRAIEVPLNSPNPLASIKKAVDVAEQLVPNETLIGAGTVLTSGDVRDVLATGANLIVSPNVNPEVIRHAVEGGAVCLPGVLTPTEAHLALASGATGLKFFPASLAGPDGIMAIRSILPADTEICAVGGVSEENFEPYWDAGVRSFGLGSSLFQPNFLVSDIRAKAKAAVAEYRKLNGGR